MGLKEEIKKLEQMFSDPLIFEKKMMEVVLMRLQASGVPKGRNRKKNSRDSIAYRERGSNLFLQKVHSPEEHEETLKLYSQSVALAPNDSEELAMAYGNRSALLLHLKKYEDCMKDCDLAMKVTKSDILNAKLLCRKVQCLKALDDSRTDEVSNNVLRLIRKMNLDSSVKETFINKLNNLGNKKSEHSSDDKESSEPEKVYEIPVFARQQEAPCASEAVTIEYSEEWGRHIVATRDIEPGEIIALEKIYYSFIYPDKMWVYCQYCSKLAWSSMPCKGCIFGVYCSEECRQQAWDKFHKYECKVFPHVWDIDEDIKCPTSVLRFLLIAVHEAGGIRQLKEEVMDVYKNKDQLRKGFSEDGVFHSGKFRSLFSLGNNRDTLDHETCIQMLLNAGPPFYYLATNTDFFGKKLPRDPLNLILLDDAAFIAGLIGRLYYLLPVNTSELIIHYDDLIAEGLGLSLAPFCSLINHSCDPNVYTIKTKNEEILVYAKYPIQKGEQIFRAYLKQEFLENTKEERQEKLLDAFHFECKCLACTENWSKICLPYAKDMLWNDTATLLKIAKEGKKNNLIYKDILCKHSKYSPELMAEVAKILKIHANYVSVHCQDYDFFVEYMYNLYNRSFGSWHVIPDC